MAGIGMEYLKEVAKALPQFPGVYLFRDKNQKVVYVGKAKNLKKRVSSYFSKRVHENYKVHVLVRQIRKIDHIVVDTESDALLLENNMIKEYQPRYNVMLKDDKTYPFICIKNEPFPRIFLTRERIEDGSEYFGPYTSAFMARTIIEFIKQLYSLRNCKYNLTPENIAARKIKVCLEYHVGNCKAPCVGKQSSEDYLENINQIRTILKGNLQSVKDLVRSRMELFAGQFEFEKAQEMKNKLDIMERYQARSTIVNPGIKDLDVFSIVENEGLAVVNYLKVHNGAVIKARTTGIKKILGESKEDLLFLVVTNMRTENSDFAKEIVVPFKPEIPLPNVKITVPKKGDKLKILELSTRNAKYYLMDKQTRSISETNRESFSEKMETARKDLGLSEVPVHIECFDNSNIQGVNPVSACVVFRNGTPSRSEYRHYNIKDVKGPDDFASMREVVKRRYSRMIMENTELPQLIVIDGGKGQLSSAYQSLKELGLENKIEIISIAKRIEEIFSTRDNIPLFLGKKSGTLRLIQHLRDEAHRFSLLFHRQKRSSAFTKSILESLPGIGPSTAENLYKHFKSFSAIQEASLDELAEVTGKSKASKIISGIKGTLTE